METGVGGVAALYDYYQEYVLKYEENMKRKVETMMEKQRQLELNAYSSKYLTVLSSCNVSEEETFQFFKLFV